MQAIIKVSKLPLTANRLDLTKAFSQFGQVVSAKILVDPVTGISSGSGSVQFETYDSVIRATQAPLVKVLQADVVVE